MKSIILPEQKGFIKSRYILDAIIALWKAVELAEESDQSYIFLKVDFHKAYDRIEWDFIFQSMQDAGFGKKFIKLTQLLFGNAFAKVAINGDLSGLFPLRRSTRQGCPIATLLFAICYDSLGWLVKDALSKGNIQGIQVPGFTSQLCLQQFADDTNGLIRDDPRSIGNLLTYLDAFCTANGSEINHNKIGYRSSTGSTPSICSDAGYKELEDGQSGFKLSREECS
ncbi:hypothetical protein L7F22_039554 [Adiantum nelumboides]|nr:hypothetical protein [Adiantum nelumboides]